jgi:predicted RNase H-like HicB family nuclease
MLTEYISKAMSKAVYDKLDDGSFSGGIPACPGVVAFGETLYQCQKELESSLEGWLIVKIRHGDDLPIIDRLDLNKSGVLWGRGMKSGAPNICEGGQILYKKL